MEEEEVVEVVVFTRENRRGSAQHATRATPTLLNPRTDEEEEEEEEEEGEGREGGGGGGRRG